MCGNANEGVTGMCGRKGTPAATHAHAKGAYAIGVRKGHPKSPPGPPRQRSALSAPTTPATHQRPLNREGGGTGLTRINRINRIVSNLAKRSALRAPTTKHTQPIPHTKQSLWQQGARGDAEASSPLSNTRTHAHAHTHIYTHNHNWEFRSLRRSARSPTLSISHTCILYRDRR